MKRGIDFWQTADKAIYAAVFIILVFAFGVALEEPLDVGEEPLGAPIRGVEPIEEPRIGEITNIPWQLKEFGYELVDEKGTGRKIIKIPGRKEGTFFWKGKEFIVPLNEEDYFREVEITDYEKGKLLKAVVKIKKGDYTIFTDVSYWNRRYFTQTNTVKIYTSEIVKAQGTQYR